MQLYSLNVFQKDYRVIAQDIVKNLDFYLFTEVRKRDIAGYKLDGYELKESLSMDDRCIVLLNKSSIECIDSRLLKLINPLRIGRDPIYGLYKIDGESIAIVGLHLPRRNAPYRWLQAFLLAKWAGKQGVPVLIVGDLNCDISTSVEGKADKSFNILSKAMTWVRPTKILPTQCSRHRSILDAAFTLGIKESKCDILCTEESYCSAGRSDHRPILVEVNQKETEDMSRSYQNRRKGNLGFVNQQQPSEQANEQDALASQVTKLLQEKEELLKYLDQATTPVAPAPVQGSQPFDFKNIPTIIGTAILFSLTGLLSPFLFKFLYTKALELFNVVSTVDYSPVHEGVEKVAEATSTSIGFVMPYLTPVIGLVAVLAAFLTIFIGATYVAKWVESTLYKVVPVLNSVVITLAVILTLISGGYVAHLMHLI